MEGATPEIYVRPFPVASAGGVVKVSSGGGHLARWSGDGHTVYRVGAPACVLDPVNAYLVSLTTPREARC